MNREIDTNELQRKINETVGKVEPKKKIVKMTVYYDDGSSVHLLEGGKVFRLLSPEECYNVWSEEE